jgi:RecA-family ATPase
MSGTDLDRDRWLREEQHHDRRTSWTAAELMAIEFPEPRWAVPGILAEGLNLLCGPPKLGKSWFALNVAVAVSMGTKAFGRVHVDQGDVLYLALEDPGRRLQSRLRMVLGLEPAPERLTLETACPAIADGGAELIDKWLGEHPDARLVIVDVFTRIRGKVNDRSGRYEADYEAMAAIKTIADEWGIAILVVHHTRKQHAADFLDTVSGTHGLAGAADAVLVLERSRGSAEAKLQITGRDVEETEYALNFAGDVGTWQFLEGPRATTSSARRVGRSCSSSATPRR